MKQKNLLIGIAIVVCAALGIFAIVKLQAPSSGGGDDDDDVATPTGVEPIVTVQVGALKRVTLHDYVSGYGDIEAAPATKNRPAGGGGLAPPSAGIVAKVNVIAGQRVKKGEVLIELNSSSASFDYAQAEVGRQEKLYAQQNTSLKNVEDARAQLASLEIIAPVSGIVTTLNARPGQAVDPSTAVAEVIDFRRLAVSTKIPAAQAAQLQTGQDVQIQSDPPVTVPLSFVGTAVNPDDGTVPAWALLPSDTQLRPGQFVPLKIVTAVHTNTLAAPADSVVTDESGNSTISLVTNSETALTPVQTGFREDGWVEVSAPGLKEGNFVVTVGAYGLADKTKIIIDLSDAVTVSKYEQENKTKIKIAGPGDETSATNSPAAQ